MSSDAKTTAMANTESFAKLIGANWSGVRAEVHDAFLSAIRTKLLPELQVGACQLTLRTQDIVAQVASNVGATARASYIQACALWQFEAIAICQLWQRCKTTCTTEDGKDLPADKAIATIASTRQVFDSIHLCAKIVDGHDEDDVSKLHDTVKQATELALVLQAVLSYMQRNQAKFQQQIARYFDSVLVASWTKQLSDDKKCCVFERHMSSRALTDDAKRWMNTNSEAFEFEWCALCKRLDSLGCSVEIDSARKSFTVRAKTTLRAENN